MGITEDSINSIIYSYLKNQGLNIEAQVTTKIYGKTFKPDFYLHNDIKIYGEGEWQKSLASGLSQAATYLDANDVDASFTLIYSNNLENEVKSISDDTDLQSVLEQYSYHIYYKRKSEPMAHERVRFGDFTPFFEKILHKKVIPKPDVDVFIETIHHLANEIFEILPKVNEETLSLYQNILGSQDDLKSPDIDFDITSRNAAGYLFINQLIFYSILSSKRENFSEINVNNISNISDLKNYFLKVLEFDFKPVFSIDVVSQFPEEKIDKIKEIIRAIQFLGPEYIESDVIGRIFHKLIPITIRKKVAAYYTKPESAELLAFFAINDHNVNIIDPACGSGQLLIASYKRMKQIYEITTGKSFGKDLHKKFLERQITGIDIMPFSTHLSLINLTLQNLDFLANYLRIAIYDSTKLVKNATITPLQSFLKQVQKTLTQFTTSPKIKTQKSPSKLIGSITLDGKAGVTFKLTNINIVIMNPPFTRQELINKLANESEKQYKKHLIENIVKPPFKKFEKIINEKQSFSTYFLFLADKILEDNGILASVLPATILRDDVNSETRKFFIKNYSFKYIFTRYDAMNFSDDTTFREILLIMQKKKPTNDHLVTYISLRKLSLGIGPDIKYQEELISDVGIHDFENFTIQKIPQSELKVSNLNGPIALKNPELQKIWQQASRVKRFLTKLPSIEASEGARSRNYGLVPEMCIVRELDSRTKFTFEKISQNYLHFTSVGGIKYKIPLSNVHYYCRRANHKTMSLGSLKEFVIHKIEDGDYFEEIEPKIHRIYRAIQDYGEKFKNEYHITLDKLKTSKSPKKTKKDIINYLKKEVPEWVRELISIFGKKEDEILKHTRKMVSSQSFSSYQASWQNYLKGKLCYLGTIETFHVEAPNTYFFAYFSGNQKRIYSSIFNNVFSLDEIEAKINCIWLNSAINLLQLFVERIPTGWFKIRQYVLESLKIIDIQRLKDAEKDVLLKIFEDISNKEFPCIWQQILRNVAIADVSLLNKELICETFKISDSDYENLVNNPFEPRIKMDTAILKTLFPRKKKQEINEILNQIYFYLIDEILVAKKLVSN